MDYKLKYNNNTMSNTTITVLTNDNQKFEVPIVHACRSNTLKNLMGDLSDNCGNEIPLPQCNGEIFSKIIKYWEHYPTDPDEKDEYNFLEFSKDDAAWNNEFFELGQEGTLNNHESVLKIILAADYLDYPRLLKHGCKVTADQIKGKTPQQICEMFKFPMPTEEQLAEAEKQISKK